jgi:PKD repeat protein
MNNKKKIYIMYKKNVFLYIINTKSMKLLFIFTINIFLFLSVFVNAQIPTSNLQLWLRSDTGVVHTAGVVEAWQDISGNNHHLTQTEANRRPLLIANVLNGYPALRFDGSNDYLRVLFGQSFTPPNTVFCVFNMQSTTAQFVYDGGTSFHCLRYINPDLLARVASAQIGYSKPAPFDFIISTINFNTSNSQMFENGMLKQSGTIGTGSGLNGFTLGSAYSIGSFFNGDVVEVLVYDGLLSVSDRVEVETYLMNKYSESVTLGQDIYVNYGFCDTILSIPSEFSNVLWSTGDTTHSISVNMSGEYWVQAKDYFGRVSSDTVYVQFPGQKLADTLLCLGDTLAITTGLDLGYSFLWSTLETSSVIQVSSEGIYSVMVSDTLGCFYMDSCFVSIDDYALSVSLGGDTSLCAGNTIQLVSGVNEAVSYLWHPGNETTASISIVATGTYSIEVANANGCVGVDSIDVTIVGVAPVPDYQMDYVCFGDTTLFTDLSSPQANIAQRMWVFNGIDTLYGQTVEYVFSAPGLHTLELFVEDSAGCGSSLIDTIEILPIAHVGFVNNPPCTSTPLYLYGETSMPQGTLVNNYNWSINGVGVGSSKNIQWSFLSSGLYDVCFSVALDNGCVSEHCSIIQVADSYAIPQVSLLSIPPNNSMVPSSNCNFKWSVSTEALYYKLIISDDSTMNNPLVFVDSLQMNEVAVMLPDTGVYFWKVLSCNPCNDCSESAISKFEYFSPLSIQGLKLWVRSDTGVVLNNSTVEEWHDMSGNNYNLAQTQQNRMPEFVVDVLNGYPALRFSSSFLKVMFDTSYIQPNTIFSIFRTFSGNDMYIYDGGSSFHALMYHNSSQVVRMRVSSSVLGYPKQSPFKFIISTTEFNTSNSKIFENGSLQNFGMVGTGSGIDGVTIGAPYTTTAPYFEGDMLEFLFFDRVLTESQRVMVESYLMDKYAPPVNLGPDIVVDYGFCDTILSIPTEYSNVLWSTGDTTHSISVNLSGAYWVQATDLFGRVSSDTVLVHYPGAVLTNQTICLGDTIIYDSGLGLEYTFDWSTGASTPHIQLWQAGNFWVEVSDSLGCSRTQSFVLQVDSFSVHTSLGGSVSICLGDDISLVSGASEAVSYLWSTGETTTSIIPPTAGTYGLTVANALGCEAVDDVLVSFHGVKPTALFGSDTVCMGFPTALYDHSIATVPDVIQSWTWIVSGDTLVQQNPSYTFANGGLHVVELFVETQNGCRNDVSGQVFVLHNPIAHFLPFKGCSGVPIQFNNLSTLAGGGTFSTWQWSVFDSTQTPIASSGDTHPQLSFPGAGQYEVMLIATSAAGCVDTVKNNVDIRNTPPVDFTWQNTCFGETTSFMETTQVPAYELIMERSWDFGNAITSVLPNPSVSYDAVGVYDVTLYNRSINGCEASITKQVEIHPLPVAAFSYSNTCVNSPVLFNDMSHIASGSINEVYWIFPDNTQSSLQNPYYTFGDTGVFHVSLLATSQQGCQGSVILPILIYPTPQASFTLFPEYGVPPLEVDFTNTSANAVAYEWHFGDGASSVFVNPQHTYLSSQVYEVMLKASNTFLCNDTAYGMVYVIPSNFDVAVLRAEQNEQGGFVSSTVEVRNLGNRVIRTLQMKIQVDNMMPSTEIWEGVLVPGQSMEYTYAVLLDKQSLETKKSVCYTALPNEVVEDINPENNTYCVVLESDFYILSITPNPATDEIFAKVVLKDEGVFMAEIVSTQGQKVIEAIPVQGIKGINSMKINTSVLRSGVYLLRIYNEQGSHAYRFVIMR